jgi:L-iditol 2-dehydrogenase
MKQLVCLRTNYVEIRDVPEPSAGAGELLVRMSACGICGTDLMKVYGVDTVKPVQLGHEIVGIVLDVGVGVTRFARGQRVAVAHHAPDHASHYARRGSATQDPIFKASNVDPGGFADMIRVPADLVPHTVFVLPDDIPDMRAVFMEPLACCLRALDRAPVVEGDTVLVVGAGSIGLLFVPLLRSRGATVLAADVRAERLAIAKAWGAVVGSDDVAVQTKLSSSGRGADLVILTVVNPATLELAFASVRDGGCIIPFGVKPGMMPPVDLWQLYRREISLVTSYSTTPDLLQRALALLSRSDFALETTISHRFPLRDAAQGFALLNDAKASKVVITGET